MIQNVPKPQAWDEIVKRVVEPFDQDDIAQRCAVVQWLNRIDAQQEDEPLGKVVHEFASDEVLAAVVAFFHADIEENIAIFRAKMAETRRYEAYVKVRSALAHHAGVFPSDDETIDVARLAVIRKSRDAEQTKLRKLLDLSVALTEADDPEAMIEGSQLPGSLRQDEAIQAFLSDLVAFIGASGDRGRDLISRVCEDENEASRVKRDNEMPQPLRFLAGVALEIHRQSITLPAVRRPVGFGAAVERE